MSVTLSASAVISQASYRLPFCDIFKLVHCKTVGRWGSFLDVSALNDLFSTVLGAIECHRWNLISSQVLASTICSLLLLVSSHTPYQNELIKLFGAQVEDKLCLYKYGKINLPCISVVHCSLLLDVLPQ